MKQRSAFSLVELSFVIIIIAILVSGVTYGSKIISKIHLKEARKITQDAKITEMRGLSLWFETTMKDSFNKNESYHNGAISQWFDLADKKDDKFSLNQIVKGKKPTYVINSLNGLPTLFFDGEDALFSNQNLGLEGNPDFTFIVVAKAMGGNYGPFINSGDIGTCAWVTFGRGKGKNNGAIFTGFFGGGQSYIHKNLGSESVFAIHTWTRRSTQNNKSGNEVFVNSTKQELADEDITCQPSITDSLMLVGVDRIGNYFTGNIAEIMIFNRQLDYEERQEIENYLARKWGIKITAQQNSSEANTISL